MKRILSAVLALIFIFSAVAGGSVTAYAISGQSIAEKNATPVNENGRYEVEIQVPGGDGREYHDEVIIMVDGSYSTDDDWSTTRAAILEIGKTVLEGNGNTRLTVMTFGMGDNIVVNHVSSVAQLNANLTQLPGGLLYGRSSTNCEAGFTGIAEYIAGHDSSLNEVHVVYITDGEVNTDETPYVFYNWTENTWLKKDAITIARWALEEEMAGYAAGAIKLSNAYLTVFGDPNAPSEEEEEVTEEPAVEEEQEEEVTEEPVIEEEQEEEVTEEPVIEEEQEEGVTEEPVIEEEQEEEVTEESVVEEEQEEEVTEEPVIEEEQEEEVTEEPVVEQEQEEAAFNGLITKGVAETQKYLTGNESVEVPEVSEEVKEAEVVPEVSEDAQEAEVVSEVSEETQTTEVALEEEAEEEDVITDEEVMAWAAQVWADVYAYSGMNPETAYTVSDAERAFVKYDKEHGTHIQEMWYYSLWGRSYPDRFSRTPAAGLALAANSKVAHLYMVDSNGATSWMSNMASSANNVSFYVAGSVSNLLSALSGVLTNLAYTPYNDVVVTDYMSKWVNLDKTTIKVVDNYAGKTIWTSAEGWLISENRPTAQENPVIVEEVPADAYANGGPDVVGNENGTIYKLTWYVKDGAMLRNHNYSLVYEVDVDTQETGFEYNTDYPANGNTTIDYTEKNGDETTEVTEEIDVPDVIVEKTEVPPEEPPKDEPEKEEPPKDEPEKDEPKEEPKDEPKDESGNPKTGDTNSLIWLPLLMVSAIGLILTAREILKRKEN